MCLWIARIPPGGVILEPLLKPCEECIRPLNLLLRSGDDMIFAMHLDKGHLTAQDLQCIVHLDALADGDIRVVRTMNQQQRRVNLVGVKERTLLRVELWIIPRIAVVASHRTVVDAPGALAPVGGERTDARMADRCRRTS